nr:PREDICTED: mitochondria-eating protein-like [Latimeria chalumnae]|eukprot:XP_014345477.1 PREDICTED: mitochondria-eating protein-like [Latimeria chalumnae]
MADNLRRLITSGTYNLLHEKAEALYTDYRINSCEQNLNRCCELIELTSKVQSQLFSILNRAANEGGLYGGADTLKTRLLPWLCNGFLSTSSSVTSDTSLVLIQESAEKDRKLRDLEDSHEQEVQELERELRQTRMELEDVRDMTFREKLSNLDQLDEELEGGIDKSSDTFVITKSMIAEQLSKLKIIELEVDGCNVGWSYDVCQIFNSICGNPNGMMSVSQIASHVIDSHEDMIANRQGLLRAAQQEADMCRRKLEAVQESENQIRRLKGEVSYLTTEKNLLQDRLVGQLSPLPSISINGLESPSYGKHTNTSRHSRLVAQFKDIFTNDRLDAQNLLLRHIDSLEMVQRIIFTAVQEAFHVAKMAFREFRLHARKRISATHVGPEPLDEVVMDYIIRNLDLYDVQASVNDVIRAMNVNPKISFPPEVDFTLLSGFIREVCRTAYAMQALEPPLDIAFASDGEIFSEVKYRRSYDSEFSAPLIAYHVWPALTKGNSVLLKGEAVTRRGARLSPRPSRSRSISPVHSRTSSPSRAMTSQSRSPSPTRRSLSPSRGSRPNSRLSTSSALLDIRSI